MAALAVALVFAITGWMLKSWLTHQERMRALALDQQRMGAAEHRLERMEQAVEAIALEVERIGEGQRYVTSLLQARAEPALPSVAAANGSALRA